MDVLINKMGEYFYYICVYMCVCIHVCVSDHAIVHFKYPIILFVDYTSKLKNIDSQTHTRG